MTVKGILRPLPGVKRVSLLRQRLAFAGSADYWERNYRHGGTSGDGSYGALANAKAEFLNSFVSAHRIQSVIEFGCGDGNQLSLSSYPHYVGMDISPTAIDLCKSMFADDATKSFFLYDGARFIDRAGMFVADLSLSLDVVYHLVEDRVFEEYMKHLFDSGRRYVIVYTTNIAKGGTAPHVRHRDFASWVENNCSSWHLVELVQGSNKGPDRADFFVYERVVRKS